MKREALALMPDKHVRFGVVTRLKIVTYNQTWQQQRRLHIRFDLLLSDAACSFFIHQRTLHLCATKRATIFLLSSDLSVLLHVWVRVWEATCLCVFMVCGFHGCFTVSWLWHRPWCRCCCCSYMFNVIVAKTRLATITSEYSAQTKPSDCFKLLSVCMCVCVSEL